jgi:hypothetical protein
MRLCLLAFLVACGGSHSNGNADGNGNGDGKNSDSLGSNPTTITVTLTNRPNTAATYTFIAAYQDGASAWQAAPAPSGDTYSFTVTSPVWGFAWTCVTQATNLGRVELAYFAVSEKTSLTETVPRECSDRYPANVGVSGDVQNESNATGNFASYAARTVQVMTGNDTFVMEAPPGPHDLFVSHVTGAAGTGALAVDHIAVVRGVTAPTTTATVDWNTAAAVQTAAVTAPTGANASTTLYSAGGTNLTLSAQNAGPYQATGLPASLAMTGDVYDQLITVRGNGGGAAVESWASAIATQSYPSPAGLGGSISTVAGTTPYPEISTMWAAYANATAYAWDARQGASVVGAATTRWTTIFGPGYLGGSPKFQMPDLSMLAGWSAKLAFQTGVAVAGTTAAEITSAGISDIPPVTPAAPGTQRTTVTSDWTVTP